MVKIGEELKNNKFNAASFIKKPQLYGFDDIFKAKPILQFNYAAVDSGPKNREEVAKMTGLSNEFVDRIIKYEGFENKIYKDQAGIRTVGVGHNVDNDSTYCYGDTISNEKVYKLLAKDLIKVKKDISNCLGNVELNKNQQDAMADLFFNVGAEKLQNSKLINSIKNKKFEEAAGEFSYIKAKGTVIPGLCLRRIDDVDKFCSGRYNSKTIKALKYISSKGEEACIKKIKRAPRAKREFFIAQKAQFEQSVKQTMARAKQSLNVKYYAQNN